jgi:hypothetical protein
MKTKSKIIFTAIILSGFFGLAETSRATTMFNEDFEYGQTCANLASCEGLSGFTTKWNGDSKETAGDSLAIVSSQSHSGSHSLHFSQTSAEDTFLEANYSYGGNVWIEYWIRPEASNSDNNKMLYVYTSPSGPSVWCMKMSSSMRWTGSCTYDNVSQSTGWAFDYLGAGCATKDTGLQNLSVQYYLPSQWNRMILHVQYIGANNTLVEMWTDNGSGLIKTGSSTVTDSECAWPSANPTAGRIKVGLMTGNGSLYYYLDDIKIATSSGDIDWGTPPNTTPPAAPTGLSVQ